MEAGALALRWAQRDDDECRAAWSESDESSGLADAYRREFAAALDAALGATYTAEPCGICGGKGSTFKTVQATDGFGNASEVPVGVAPCPSCNGSGRSAPRLALIDVLVAQGALAELPLEARGPLSDEPIKGLRFLLQANAGNPQ